MSRALLVLHSDAQKMQACNWIKHLPYGSRIEFKKPRRTLPQNDRLWGMLTDIAMQVKWYGQRLTPADWKLMFMVGLKKELRAVPNLDGNGFVNLGTSSSDLSVEEMSELFALIEAFGAEQGVEFKEDKQ